MLLKRQSRVVACDTTGPQSEIQKIDLGLIGGSMQDTFIYKKQSMYDFGIIETVLPVTSVTCIARFSGFR